MGLSVGIVGGLGPYAGLDLIRKLHDSVDVHSDQDYPDVIMVSVPRVIPDRSRYILNPHTQNPAVGIIYCVEKLAKAGATHIGIPCNTAHSPIIMNQVRAYIELNELPVTLLDIVQETYNFAKEHLGNGKVGLLATSGTYASEVYHTQFESEKYFEIISPAPQDKEEVYSAIYSKEFGIKTWSNPVKDQAIEIMARQAKALRDRGAESVIMGCTEIPLAMEKVSVDFPLLDPALILARALVKAVLPQRLKPLRRR